MDVCCFVTRFALCGMVLLSSMLWAADEADSGPNYTPPSVEELRNALAGDVEARYEVLTRVTPRGFSESDRAKIVELLIAPVDDENPHVRSLAAQSLELFGSEAKPALPKLMARLEDRALSRTPTTIASFEGVWVSMSKAIAAIGPDAIGPLVEELPDSTLYEFFGIAATLSEMGPAAKSVAPQFIEILRRGPKERRWAATYTLSKLGDAALPAIPDYVANLDDEDFNIQVISCRALAALGPASQVAVPRLMKLLDEGILSSRTHAAMCLGAIGPVEDIDLVEHFTDMVQEVNAFCQERGMIALGRLGPHAASAAPLIDRLIDEEFFSQKPEAALALFRVTGKAERTLAVMERLIDNPTYDSRVYAALQEMGPAAARLAPRIASMLVTGDQSLRLTLVEILEAMGPAAPSQLDALRARLADSSREVVLAIDRAIAPIEEKAP